MDLYSVRARLTHGWYLNMGQFIQDINLGKVFTLD